MDAKNDPVGSLGSNPKQLATRVPELLDNRVEFVLFSPGCVHSSRGPQQLLQLAIVEICGKIAKEDHNKATFPRLFGLGRDQVKHESKSWQNSMILRWPVKLNLRILIAVKTRERFSDQESVPYCSDMVASKLRDKEAAKMNSHES